MTQTRNFAFALAMAGTTAFSGCALQQMVKKGKEQELTVTPSPLEVHGDSVKFEMSAVLPQKTLKKGKVYQVNTFYQYGNDELELEPIRFDAADYDKASSEQPRQTKEYAFAYNPDMKQGEVIVQGEAINPSNDKSRTTDRMPVAEGVVNTSELVNAVSFAAYAEHGYVTEEELEPTNIEFYFAQGSAVLRPTEKQSETGAYFNAFLAEKNVTRTVTITGTHSPEGPERVNDKLAENRAKAIEQYYRQQMRRYDYQGMADSIEFVIKPVVEDWTEFKEMLEEFDGINSDQKSEVKSIVDGSGDFESKEKQLQRLPFYNQLFRELYPQLRTAKTEILTVKEKKPESEIAVLSRQIGDGTIDADTLSSEELAYGATLTPSVDEKEKIYKAAVKKDDSWAAHNNLGAVYIQKAQQADSEEDMNKHLENALNEFELSNKKQENAEAYSNMAVVYALQGNREKAMDALDKAEGFSPRSEVVKGDNGVKGAIQIKNGDYEGAINSLSNAEETTDNLYNKGLAQLLNKDYQNALSTFNEVIEMESDHAKAHYGAAVASARAENESEAYSHLEKAVSNDPSLKERALNDLEFKKYHDNDEFKNTLK